MSNGRKTRKRSHRYSQTNLDPNNYNQNNSAQNEQNKVMENIERSIRLRSPADGNINRQKFNEILFVLEENGFPQIRDTPVGLRLFDVFSEVVKN